LIQGCAFMSFLRIIGPASIEVWISSPVRSRKPVLMNTMRSRALDAGLEVDRGAALLVHDADLDGVRGRPSMSSTRPNSSQVKRDLVGPCIFGLTM
jgi:hypothetical protein